MKNLNNNNNNLNNNNNSLEEQKMLELLVNKISKVKVIQFKYFYWNMKKKFRE